MMRRLSASALVLSLFFLSRLAAGQTAAISGTVTDATAAVVPQVKVTARNLATNVSRSTSTDGSGSYRITSLLPERFMRSFATAFTISHVGFIARAGHSGIPLSVAACSWPVV